MEDHPSAADEPPAMAPAGSCGCGGDDDSVSSSSSPWRLRRPARLRRRRRAGRRRPGITEMTATAVTITITLNLLLISYSSPRFFFFFFADGLLRQPPPPMVGVGRDIRIVGLRRGIVVVAGGFSSPPLAPRLRPRLPPLINPEPTHRDRGGGGGIIIFPHLGGGRRRRRRDWIAAGAVVPTAGEDADDDARPSARGGIGMGDGDGHGRGGRGMGDLGGGGRNHNHDHGVGGAGAGAVNDGGGGESGGVSSTEESGAGGGEEVVVAEVAASDPNVAAAAGGGGGDDDADVVVRGGGAAEGEIGIINVIVSDGDDDGDGDGDGVDTPTLHPRHPPRPPPHPPDDYDGCGSRTRRRPHPGGDAASVPPQSCSPGATAEKKEAEEGRRAVSPSPPGGSGSWSSAGTSGGTLSGDGDVMDHDDATPLRPRGGAEEDGVEVGSSVKAAVRASEAGTGRAKDDEKKETEKDDEKDDEGPSPSRWSWRTMFGSSSASSSAPSFLARLISPSRSRRSRGGATRGAGGAAEIARHSKASAASAAAVAGDVDVDDDDDAGTKMPTPTRDASASSYRRSELSVVDDGDEGGDGEDVRMNFDDDGDDGGSVAGVGTTAAAPSDARVDSNVDSSRVDRTGGHSRGGIDGGCGRFVDPRGHGGSGGGGDDDSVGSSPSDSFTADERGKRSVDAGDGGGSRHGGGSGGGGRGRGRGRGRGGSSVATISSPSPFSGYHGGEVTSNGEEGDNLGLGRGAVDGETVSTRPATAVVGDARYGSGVGMMTSGPSAETKRSRNGGDDVVDGDGGARRRSGPTTPGAVEGGRASAEGGWDRGSDLGPAGVGGDDEVRDGEKNSTSAPYEASKGFAIIGGDDCNTTLGGCQASDGNVTAVSKTTANANATSTGQTNKKKKKKPYNFDGVVGMPTFDYLEHLSRGPTSAPSSKSRRPPPPPTSKSTPPPLAYDGRPLDPNATLTVADLEAILARNGYLPATDEGGPAARRKKDWDGGKSTVVRVGKGGDKKRVAFPQDSVLTKSEIVTSATFVSTLLGLIVSQTVSPNLWLVGAIAGGYYGNGVANRARYERRLKGDRLGGVRRVVEEDVVDEETGEVVVVSVTTNPASELVLNLAERLAVFCLRAYDVVNRIWFMYKTGQLSYEYYKRYEDLDQRFKIQDKLDAWNARFQEGKLNFDKWEQENEVGRKVLAGMRTFWLLEEKSYKKVRARGRKSRYRIVQYANDTLSFLKRFLEALWQLVTGRGSTELEELSQGVRDQISNLNFEILGQQIGSGLAALVVVNLSGAIFLVAPSFMATVGFAMGFIWPTWISGAYRRITATVRDTAARGRRRKMMMRGGSSNKNDRFHYFVREDGTKRWYRTGRPLFGPAAPKSNKLEAKRVEQRQLPLLDSMFGNQAEKKTDEQRRQFPSLSNVFRNQAEEKEDTRRKFPFFGRMFGNRGQTKKSG